MKLKHQQLKSTKSDGWLFSFYGILEIEDGDAHSPSWLGHRSSLKAVRKQEDLPLRAGLPKQSSSNGCLTENLILIKEVFIEDAKRNIINLMKDMIK